jgi:hypothetical protein
MARSERRVLQACLALGLWTLPGCGLGDGDLADVDPVAAPLHPTYEAHIAPLMEAYCTACHAAGEGGEGGEVRYDGCKWVVRNWAGLRSTALDGRSMPPPTARVLTSADRLTLERWWRDGHACP